MENIVDKFIHENKIRFPDGPLKRFSYGTAGFRDNSDLLDCVIFRSSLIASLRSKCARGAIGVVITASHNPEQDNGVKFVDTQGQMLVPEWEVVAANIANSKFDDMRVIIVDVISRYNLENDFKPIIIIGRDTRPSSDRLVKVITDGLSLLNSQYIDIGK
jgi:phosphoacetylglucosamine mutase